MGRLRRRLRFLGGIANAVSHGDAGPYAGAPRDPDLRVGDEKSWSTVRYTSHRGVAYEQTIQESNMPSIKRARERARRHIV
jgi:hypothetical protein